MLSFTSSTASWSSFTFSTSSFSTSFRAFFTLRSAPTIALTRSLASSYSVLLLFGSTGAITCASSALCFSNSISCFRSSSRSACSRRFFSLGLCSLTFDLLIRASTNGRAGFEASESPSKNIGSLQWGQRYDFGSFPHFWHLFRKEKTPVRRLECWQCPQCHFVSLATVFRHSGFSHSTWIGLISKLKSPDRFLNSARAIIAENVAIVLSFPQRPSVLIRTSLATGERLCRGVRAECPYAASFSPKLGRDLDYR